MQTQQKRMIGHGAIVIFIGLAAGFGLVMSLIGGFELFPGHILEFEVFGDTRAWARAHAGGIMNGLFVISVALLTHAMSLSSKAATQLYWMLVGTGYANTLFYWGALFAPSRALTFGDNRLGETNIAGILGFGPALVFAVVAMIAMVIVAREAFSDRS